MNINDYFEKHNNRTLKDEEWEHLAEALIRAKFERDKKAEWAQRLSEQGIYRTPPSTITLRSVNIRKLMAAASLLLLLAAGGWYFFLRSPLSPVQEMASQYLDRPFRINEGNTRGEDSIEKNRGKAYEAFNNRQFEKSLQYLRMVEVDGKAKAADFFQMGLCLLYQQKPDYPDAVKSFQEARRLDANAYIDEINWYSGLCYLMMKDESAAATYLQKVVDSPSSRNRDAALQLLQRLKK